MGKKQIFRKKTKKELRGLGDVVKATTDILGIKQCGRCKKRQEWLNEKIPFKKNTR